MTHDKHKRPDEDLSAWETQVNALLDGELEKASTEALKHSAADDPDLAQAIIAAYELQRGMDQVGIERAPAGLQRKLRQIPRMERRIQSPRRWVMATAFAIVPLLVIGLVLLQPRQPSQAEVEQARHGLAVAFAYIDKAGLLTGDRIHHILSSELENSVTDPLSKHIPYTKQSRKEKQS